MRMRNFWAMAGFTVMGVLAAKASVPEVSTDADPKWYYIQVVGEDARKDRVFTAVDGSEAVFGRPMVMTADHGAVDPQLWRFEKSGSGYSIINRSTGKYLDVTYDVSLDISKAILTDAPSVNFSFLPYDNNFQITCSKAPAGGIESEVYLHQANTGSGRDFVIMLVNTTWSNTVNSEFHFIEFIDFDVEVSDDSHRVYYRLHNSLYPDLCMTQVPSAEYPMQLSEPTEDNHMQEWWITDGTNGKINLRNRATGHTLLTTSTAYKAFNMPMLDPEGASDGGRSMEYLGGGYYALGGEEEDGIVRRLGAASESQTDYIPYDEKTAAEAGFGWKFVRTGDSMTGLETPEAIGEDIKIEGRRILGRDLRIFAIDGREIPAGKTLGRGVYIVVKNNSATKAIIR